jgi:hypothetical protein
MRRALSRGDYLWLQAKLVELSHDLATVHWIHHDDHIRLVLAQRLRLTDLWSGLGHCTGLADAD